MKEYIERNQVIGRVKEYARFIYDVDLDNSEEFAGDSKYENYCEGLYEATEIISYAPAADVKEVIRARWRGKPIAGYSTVVCTNCNARYEENTGRWKYCPNCGAKMDLEV